jgi:hypothetical protein
MSEDQGRNAPPKAPQMCTLLHDVKFRTLFAVTAVIPSNFASESSPLSVLVNYVQYLLIGTGLTNDTRIYPYSMNNPADSYINHVHNNHNRNNNNNMNWN